MTSCPHTETHIRVLHTAGTCETTVIVCSECGTQINEPKTECA